LSAPTQRPRPTAPSASSRQRGSLPRRRRTRRCRSKPLRLQRWSLSCRRRHASTPAKPKRGSRSCRQLCKRKPKRPWQRPPSCRRRWIRNPTPLWRLIFARRSRSRPPPTPPPPPPPQRRSLSSRPPPPSPSSRRSQQTCSRGRAARGTRTWRSTESAPCAPRRSPPATTMSSI
ncbi:hypothetical protein LTR33_012092, partial [Friedmanniomyces endolithicus]